ncbi:membrane protein [Ophiostoma piceae UAMH 11346]|uniref:Membrane protein n=1 Tax=Ophiostoma piceae (strain UAMH 11346) TaxID=1262450 RepID=S3CMC2_OPHP1|nr:membrane protein [Ophiostoma piceae UAMH 11346]
MTSPFPSASVPFPQVPRTPPLHLVVRFLALPDIPLEIPDPDRFSVVRLKVLIRQELARAALEDDDASSSTLTKAQQKAPAGSQLLSPTNLSNSPTLEDAPRRRLRILYSGKNLTDDTLLGHVLRPVAPPPRVGRSSSISTATSTPVGNQSTNASTNYPDGLTAGSAASPDGGLDGSRSRSSSTSVANANVARVTVSCSISDILPDSELAAEAEAAAVSEAAAERTGQQSSLLGGLDNFASSSRSGLRRDIFQRRGGSTVGGLGSAGPSGAGPSSASSSGAGPSTSAARTTTTPAPRGFQRLLQGGFSPAEVNQLRLQFNSIQASRFTPDTMPSPDTLRNLEDSWLDNNHEPAGVFGGGGGMGGDDGGASFADEEGRMPALLDLMVKAMLVGFMLPLASGCWLLREEGLWTARWRMFVSLGMMVSILIGMVKAFAGEW